MSSGKLPLIPIGALGIGFLLAIIAPLVGDMGLAILLRAVVVAIAGFLLFGLFALAKVTWETIEAYRNDFKDRARQKSVAQEAAAAAKRGQRRQQLIADLGTDSAALVESANAAISRVAASEAARGGWLGDVDFTADIAAITENLRKAHELRATAQQLSTLNQPTAQDQKILADAQRIATDLEAKANKRIGLIRQLAVEAEKVDSSLRREREDTRTAEQRAELQAKLSAMVYGAEALPTTDTGESTAADSVMARIQAYRELKNQIQHIQVD